MPNPALPKQEGQRQAPSERIKNFEEVAQGLTSEQAAIESSRCLNCKEPRCQAACPVNVKIPKFIAALNQGDIKAAIEEGMQGIVFTSYEDAREKLEDILKASGH